MLSVVTLFKKPFTLYADRNDSLPCKYVFRVNMAFRVNMHSVLIRQKKLFTLHANGPERPGYRNCTKKNLIVSSSSSTTTTTPAAAAAAPHPLPPTDKARSSRCTLCCYSLHLIYIYISIYVYMSQFALYSVTL